MRQINLYISGIAKTERNPAAGAWMFREGDNILESDARAIPIGNSENAEVSALNYALKSLPHHVKPAETELIILSSQKTVIQQLLNLKPAESESGELQNQLSKYYRVNTEIIPDNNPYLGACTWLGSQISETYIPQEKKTEPSEILCTPIGTVRSPCKNLTDSPHRGKDAAYQSIISIRKEYAKALIGLEKNDYIHIICWYHRADRTPLTVHPQKNSSAELRGVFATRSPVRPNPLALTLVHIESIQGTELVVTGLEAIDGTPVLDIKPYYPDTDTP